MNILNTPPTLPVSEAQKIATKLKQDAYSNFQRLVSSYENGLYMFWRHPRATPQEIAEALGTSAVEVFTLHAITRQIILTAKPDQVLSSVDDFGTYQVNADGSLTILSVIDPPPPPAEDPPV